jgi:hypothetical protein
MLLRSLVISSLFSLQLHAQTLGGNTVFNFLRLPNTPQLSALGGINVSQVSNDAGLAFNNPSLLTSDMHSQMNAVFNGFYAGISSYHLSLAYRHPKLNTNFQWGLNYFNYGSVTETDPAGNVLGTFRPRDWVMQVSGSRSYLEKWNYGLTFKFISSDYGQYQSNGIAFDVGVLFHDTANLFSASLLFKNMGAQLKKYAGTEAGDLPFDLEIGATKRLKNAPFSFSFTAHHLQTFDITYNDEAFNNDNGFPNASDNGFTFDKLFRHIVLATTIYLGDKVEITAGYNHLRRQELSIGNGGNGLDGFSLGAALVLDKLQVRYARVNYQNNTAYNQFGLNMTLNRYFSLGKFGERIKW